MILRLFIFSLLLPMFLPSLGGAVTYRPSTLPEQLAESDGVIIGTIEQVHGERSTGGEIRTRARIRVEYLRLFLDDPSPSRATFDLYYPGGRAGSQQLLIGGFTGYPIGQRLGLFLKRDTQGNWWSAGFLAAQFGFARNSDGAEVVKSVLFSSQWEKSEFFEQIEKRGQIQKSKPKTTVLPQVPGEARQASPLSSTMFTTHQKSLLSDLWIAVGVVVVLVVVATLLRFRQGRWSLVLVMVCATATPSLYSYVRERNSLGAPLKQAKNSPLTFYWNPDSLQNYTTTQLAEVMEISLGEWNQISTKLQLASRWTESNPATGRNDIYFSRNSYLTSSVLGMTQYQFDITSGKITESDILLNDNIEFLFGPADDPSEGHYLASVLTHELGHALGLAHSLVEESSMWHLESGGQWSLHQDDIAAVKDLLALELSSGEGKISGVVVGSDQLIGVFGAHVVAISRSSGEVVQGVLTDEEGNFSLSHLPITDSYYLLVERVDLVNLLPYYYLSLDNRYCTNLTPFSSEFFSKCQSGARGYPQGILLSQSAKIVDVGNITIHCQSAAPTAYLAAKDYASFANNSEFNLPMEFGNSGIGNAYTGLILAQEIGMTSDKVRINLSGVAWGNVDMTDLSLRLRVVAKELHSLLGYQLSVIRVSDQSLLTTIVNTRREFEEGLIDLNSELLLSLSQTSTQNDFLVEISAQAIDASDADDYLWTEGAMSTEEVNQAKRYLLIAEVVRKEGESYLPYIGRTYRPYQDNTTCPQGSLTQKNTPYITEIDRIESYQKPTGSSGILAGCGTIERPSDSSPPRTQRQMATGSGLLVALLLLWSRARKKSLRKTCHFNWQ